MPKKIRELEAALKKAGFLCFPGRGSHRKWKHPLGPLFVMSGKPGDDAKRYQERETVQAILESETKQL
jgi:predicted RNA binding protein YcfA (HicA-like mRNA interferase family)